MHFETGGGIFRRKRVVELREQSVGEAQDAHHAVLEAIAAHSAARGHRAHCRRLVVEDEAERVGVVDRDVHDNAPAGFGLLDPPALQMRRQIDSVKHPREQRLADAPLADRVSHRAVRRGVAEMMVRAEDHAARVALGDHCARIAECQRQRLLAENVLARVRRRENLVAVQLISGRDVDCIDVPRSDQIIEARGRARDPMIVRELGPAIRVRAHDRNDLSAVGAKGVDHVLRGDRAGSDEPPPKIGHGWAPGRLRVDVPQDPRTIRVVGQSTVSGSKSPLAR